MDRRPDGCLFLCEVTRMVGVNVFLANVQKICSEGPGYKEGRSGFDGWCDCIGLIIGALERAGEKWTGLHGSNWAVRNEMASLERIINSGTLIPGEAVYKSLEPGEKGYDLPDRYKGGPDLRDYCHVGVVVSTNPLLIYHVTSPGGPAIDRKIGKWKWHGWIKKITREEGRPMDVLYTATVTGGGLNQREKPDRRATLIQQIPNGTQVDVIQESGEWCIVSYGGRAGYVMTEYLQRGGEQIQVPKKELQEIYDRLGDWLGLRG